MDSVKTILVVDDDRDVRSVISFVLHKQGFRILEAENGGDALSLAATRSPDLIISDVMMDNVNGFMLLEMLKKDPATAGIPVILMTGAAEHAGAWESDKSVGYMRKPIGMETLVKEVLKKLYPNNADRKPDSKS